MQFAIADDRTAQFVMASGAFGLEEARFRLERSALVLAADTPLDAAHQALILSAAACAVRMFRGGVFMSSGVDGRLLVGQESRKPLRRALQELGVKPINPPEHAVRVHIGSVLPGSAVPDLFAWCDGWRACTSPAAPAAPSSPGNALSGAAAGGLAVADLFRKAVLNDLLACRRLQALNIWGADDAGAGVPLLKLPKQAWLVGLGNLGQATLLVLTMLPWSDPAEITLLLNDDDRAGPENLTVQVLTTYDWVGEKKARKAATWAEARGFKTIIDERRFLATTRPGGEEPRLALVGVDNLNARRWVANAGFDLVVDAGLGSTGPEAFDIRLHAFPGGQPPEKAWPELAGTGERPPSTAWKAVVDQGRLDICGAMTIAGSSVGVPCTALVAAALQVAQACRALQMGRCADRVDLTLADLRHVNWREMPNCPERLPLSVDVLPADVCR